MTEPTTHGAPGAEETLPPYRIEAARSGRSRCKTCRRAIAKDGLRLGVRIEGPYGVGYMWHHLQCAAKRHTDRLEEAYEEACWDPSLRVPKLESLRRLAEQSETRRRERKQAPYVERAPTGRSKCKQCGNPIENGAFRVVMLRKVEFGSQVRHGQVNVHPRCVGREMLEDDCAIESEGFAEALRAHSSEVEPSNIDRVIEEIGELP